MMGRPKKKVSADAVEKLAAIQCTLNEIAAVLNCSKSTLQRNFREAYTRGKRKGRMSVRREQYKLLKKGNATMAVWLGKQLLGQRDKSDFDHTTGGKSFHPITLDGEKEAASDSRLN
jgi:hypothetical protein